MLAPTDTRLLSEALRPPRGYELGQLVATTYMLDLVSLLSIPLAFTSFPNEDGEGRPTTDPLLLLEGLRRSAAKVTVFCQSGGIAVPAVHGALHVFLEESVIQVAPPVDGGVFHPKVWIVRFDGESEAIVRLICMSRNLTADRSRDTILVLEGTPSRAEESKPLAAFVDWLADAARNVRSFREKPVRELATLVRRTAFTSPDGFTAVRFHPLGIPGHSDDPIGGRRDRVLIVSPFLGDQRLRSITDGSTGSILVSRPEEIAALRHDVRDRFSETFVLSDLVDVEPEGDDTDDSPAPPGGRLRGLHAKLYVADAGRTARIWVGSANATNAAFTKNVELLVELEGPKHRFGIEQILGDRTAGFRSLLRPFVADETSPAEHNEVEWALREVASAIGAADVRAHVESRGDAHDIELRAPDGWRAPWPANARVRCWPITLAPSLASRLAGTAPTLGRFERLPTLKLTAFFAIELELTVAGKRGATRFVVRWPLVNAPAGRTHDVVMSLLDTPDRVLAFFRLMLAEPDRVGERAPGSALLELHAVIGSTAVRWATSTEPLLESLVRALEENPSRLDPIARIVEDLESADDGRERLPAGFLEIWAPIKQARDRAGRS
jgi:hypothetical protein